MYRPEDGSGDLLSLQFYSYRSLLLFKLIKEIPLPPWIGLQAVRLLVDSLLIVGIHHPDEPFEENWLQLDAAHGEGVWPLRMNYAPSERQGQLRDQREKRIVIELMKLGCFGGLRLKPGHASSIHYAGCIPHLPAGTEDRHGLAPDGRLLGTRSVYVADSSGWRYLPAKGLTLTIMANARRIARRVAAGCSTS
jgi:hypothetical protein